MLERAIAAACGGVVREADDRVAFTPLRTRGIDVVYGFLLLHRMLVLGVYRDFPFVAG